METNYTSAPAVELIATNCAVCGRPLLDSVSVECGMGPDCRKKYGYNLDCSPEDRAEANKLARDIAARQEGLEVLQAADRLRALGFVKLADAVSKKRVEIIITEDDRGVIVKAPYSEQATEAFRAVPGRRWSKDEKVNRFPASSKRELLAVLRACYPGALAIGPKGSFQLAA